MSIHSEGNTWGAGGGGGMPQRVWFLRRFGLKYGMDFAYFGLESGTGVYERIYRFNSNE